MLVHTTWIVETTREPPNHDSGSWSRHDTLADALTCAQRVDADRVWKETDRDGHRLRRQIWPRNDQPRTLDDTAIALELVRDCEDDLCRRLAVDEVRDLLADSLDWRADRLRAVARRVEVHRGD